MWNNCLINHVQGLQKSIFAKLECSLQDNFLTWESFFIGTWTLRIFWSLTFRPFCQQPQEKREQHAARAAGLPELRVYGEGRSPAPLLRRGGAPTVDARARARARARALSTKWWSHGKPCFQRLWWHGESDLQPFKIAKHHLKFQAIS